jgi:hypothetical protein
MIANFSTLYQTTGCGGSAPPTLNYTGSIEPAEITADNAYALLTGAYEGGQAASSIIIFGAAEI